MAVFVLEQFHQLCISINRCVHCSDSVANSEVLDSAITTLLHTAMCRAGHVTAKDENRLPHTVLCGELQIGKRNCRDPTVLAACKISQQQW